MDSIIEKFFTVGEVVKMNHKVVLRMGVMYGKVKLIPTEHNIFFNGEYQYIGIFDNEWAGITDVTYHLKEFMNYTGVGAFEIYKYIFNKYEEHNI